MFAAFNGTQNPFGVLMVGKRYVDCVNFCIIQQCFQIVIRLHILLIMWSKLRQRLRGSAGATSNVGYKSTPGRAGMFEIFNR